MKHGTINGYQRHRCRCDECVAARYTYDLQRRRARGVKPAGYPTEVKAEALRIYAEVGGPAASAATGVHVNTIYVWASKAGIVRVREIPAHGTASRYSPPHRCRCEDCTTANREATYRVHRSLKERAARGEIRVPHGSTNAYSNYGCRCAECRRANTAAGVEPGRRYRERQRAARRAS